MLYRVKDLSPDQKLTVEALLGRPVSEEEAVSVQAISPSSIIPSSLSPHQRQQTLADLQRYFDNVDSRRKPVTDEEEDAMITEAIRSVRPTYRPID